MSKLSYRVLSLLLVCLLWSSQRGVAQEPPSPQPVDTAALFSTIQPESPAFKMALEKFRVNVIQMRKVAVRFTVEEDPEKDEEHREQFFALQAQTYPLYYNMLAAAAKEFRMSPDRTEIASWLYSILKKHVEADQFEGMLPVVQALLEDQPDSEELIRFHCMTAIAMNEYRDAIPSINKMEQMEIISDDLLHLRDNIEQYEADWEEEKQLREADRRGEPCPRIRIETTKGPIEIELFENHAPETVANFVHLLESGAYEGSEFHSWHQHILLQVGPETRPEYTIFGEMNKPGARKFFRGTVGMALAGEEPDTGYAQFFITMMPITYFNGRFTAFGRVTRGMDVVNKFVRVPPEDDKENEKPDDPPDSIDAYQILAKRDHEYMPNKAFDFLPNGQAKDAPSAVEQDAGEGDETK